MENGSGSRRFSFILNRKVHSQLPGDAIRAMADILERLAGPIGSSFVLLVAGLALVRFSKGKKVARFGWVLTLAGITLLYACSIPAVSSRLVYSLESRYCRPQAADPVSLDVVVILGGGCRPSGGLRDLPEATEMTYSRVFNGVRIFRQSGAHVLALCGGKSIRSGETEAEIMKSIAVDLGVSQTGLLLETRSSNTMENAVELAKLLPPDREGRIGLVTSALHMRRAMNVFRKCFPERIIVPLAANYYYTPAARHPKSFIPSANALLLSTYAIHEYLGLFWYVLRY